MIETAPAPAPADVRPSVKVQQVLLALNQGKAYRGPRDLMASYTRLLVVCCTHLDPTFTQCDGSITSAAERVGITRQRAHTILTQFPP